MRHVQIGVPGLFRDARRDARYPRQGRAPRGIREGRPRRDAGPVRGARPVSSVSKVRREVPVRRQVRQTRPHGPHRNAAVPGDVARDEARLRFLPAIRSALPDGAEAGESHPEDVRAHRRWAAEAPARVLSLREEHAGACAEERARIVPVTLRRPGSEGERPAHPELVEG
jgi:hypothetical protein